MAPKKKTKEEAPKETAQVRRPEPEVTNATVRSDGDVLHGHFCRVIAGEHEGRYGVLEQTASFDEKTQRPLTVIVRTRDEHDERIVVSYSNLTPAEPGGR